MPEPRDWAHRFYANENFPRPAVDRLRQLGHDVIMTRDLGGSNRGLSDSEVLAFASADNRTVITFNRKDFVHLHRKTKSAHSGIVVCTEDLNYESLADRIHTEVESLSTLSGHLIKINRPPSF